MIEQEAHRAHGGRVNLTERGGEHRIGGRRIVGQLHGEPLGVLVGRRGERLEPRARVRLIEQLLRAQ